ncbi:MAG: ThiF family adenylyltransferase [Promethearchaeota archaeon]
MQFSSIELEQFSRQISLEGIGKIGQEVLFNSRVLIAGIGGLGTLSSLMLVRMGVGTLRLVDRDVVELSNLPRTPLFTSRDLDQPKAEIAAQRLSKMNPKCKIEPIVGSIMPTSVGNLLDDIDVVVDGLDSFQTRRTLSAECVKRNIPFVFAGTVGNAANLSTFLKEGPCFNCIFEGVDDAAVPTCRTIGVHPAIISIAVGVQISETIRLLVGEEPNLFEQILFINLRDLSFESINIKKRESCSICGLDQIKQQTEPILPYVSEVCGKNSYMVTPQELLHLDIAKARQKLQMNYKIRIGTQFGITFSYSPSVQISLMAGGNALIRGSKDADQALEIYLRVMKHLE